MYKNPRKVAVMLSTYNGQKYLDQQIQSILSQTYRDITLYIRDDGSKDNTINIIRSETVGYENVVVFEQSKNLGSRDSFLYMTEMIDSTYYMFSDQDDVWMSDKVQKSVEALEEIEKNNPNTPIIVHTDLCLVDGDMNIISESYWKYKKYPIDIKHRFELLCHFNDITGCAMIFNRGAVEVSKPYFHVPAPKRIYHDALIGLLVAKNKGVIYPLHQQTIYFRRHGGNETNPLTSTKGFLYKPLTIVNYIRNQHERYLFNNQFGYGSFAKFLCYKLLTKIYQVIWKIKFV